LLDVPPGFQAIVAGFDEMPQKRSEHLLAYGCAPGRPVQVVRHTPMTVIRVERTELALEEELAGRVQVDAQSITKIPARRRRRRRRGQRHKKS
jgi:Fe2+ transport system protein FeoA